MDKVTFKVNGVTQTVGCDVYSTTTLLEYLRSHLGMCGTKYMCKEGGCGACMVSVVKGHGEQSLSINSCLVSILSCQDWEIKTIENVGNRVEGYHPLQKTLAEDNGSQCGYCSPGMIMNMYSFLKSKPRTMLEIERALGANICRCTGYRPILQAFKKFALDAYTPSSLAIEDLKMAGPCGNSDGCCSKQKCDQSDWCLVSTNDVHDEMMHIKLKDDRDWYRVTTLTDVFDLWKKHGLESYMLVAGNTVKGVIPILQYPKMLIDVSGCSELKGYYLDQNLVIAAGCTLAEMVDIFNVMVDKDGFSYLKECSDHLDLIAHVAVRNLGTIAGNMMIKKQLPGFQSDVYLILETVGGEITILQADGTKRALSMQAYLKEEMKGKIILNVIFPPLSVENKVRTYKIMPRSQSVHALVNAGFMYKLNESNVVQECRIMYGALSHGFTRAFRAERYLVGKELFTNETLKGALAVLADELVIAPDLLEPPVPYRLQMALGLFYKSILSLCPENIVDSRYQSGALKHRETRQVSEGYQVFDTDQSLWPITKPLAKTDGLIQCAGEAQYTDDIPLQPGELHIAFVTAKVGLGTIDKIDASKALSEPGVVAFYSAKDIPGINSFIPAPNSYNLADEELFCDGQVKYYGQPVGVIVAESQVKAIYAATLVDVKYNKVKKPVVDINAAKKDPKRVSVFQSVEAKKKGTDVYKVIKGNDTIYGQYHFPMETLVCVARPTEDGLTLHCTTQWMDLVHVAVARALKLDQSRIVVIVNRLGGAYGIKIGRANQVCVATALVAQKLNQPCRMATPLTFNLGSVGKRMPCSRDFEVGVNEKGVIQYVNCDLYGDNGYIVNEPLLALGMDVYYNCYNKDLWNYTAHNVLTDTPSNTWCRSPGTLENIAMAELLIERIATEMGLDPLKVREANLDESVRDDLLQMTETIKSSARYEDRKAAVDEFNKNNRWTKRGIRFCYLRWEPVGFMNLPVNLSVYNDDGTVVITHGGVEMGQGVNSKAKQIAAYILKLPIDKIQIKANDTIIVPNGSPSGGSITSQNVGIGVRRCCEELIKRLEPVKKQMNNPSWKELVQKAYADQVDLQVHAYTTSADIINYHICGVALAEVEFDVLTGEFQVKQVDVIEDVGQSISPELDVGQIEGAFMMGMGYWTSENLVHDPSTGEVVTNRTWTYWPPQASDIPQNLRIYFHKRSYSNELIYGSKGTGEPAACMSVVVALALRDAIQAARADNGLPAEWFKIVKYPIIVASPTNREFATGSDTLNHIFTSIDHYINTWEPTCDMLIMLLYSNDSRFLADQWNYYNGNGPMTLDKICIAAATKTEDFKIC